MNRKIVRIILSWLPVIMLAVGVTCFWVAFLIFRPVTIADSLFEPNPPLENRIVWQDWVNQGDNGTGKLFVREGQMKLTFHDLSVNQEKVVSGNKVHIEPYSVQSKLRLPRVTFATSGCVAAFVGIALLWFKLIQRFTGRWPEMS